MNKIGFDKFGFIFPSLNDSFSYSTRRLNNCKAFVSPPSNKNSSCSGHSFSILKNSISGTWCSFGSYISSVFNKWDAINWKSGDGIGLGGSPICKQNFRRSSHVFGGRSLFKLNISSGSYSVWLTASITWTSYFKQSCFTELSLFFHIASESFSNESILTFKSLILLVKH